MKKAFLEAKSSQKDFGLAHTGPPFAVLMFISAFCYIS